MLDTLGKFFPYFGILMGLSCTSTTISPFWEIEDSSLPDLAMVRRDPSWGSVVVFNPVYCEQIGEACGFFRAHANAHVKLNHTILASPAHYPALQEAQADCFAGKHGKPGEVYAAVRFLREVDVASVKWKIYGDPIQRAEAIRKCAIDAGRWIGNG